MLSESVQNYIKAIYTLRVGEESVSTSALAKRLAVAPASVTQMIKKLDGMEPKLIRYRRHHGVYLTHHGEKLGAEILRHHRLIELFLSEALGMPREEVDQEAERLEHVVSNALADRMAGALGNPEFDRRGDPIGAGAPPILGPNVRSLMAMGAGESGVVVQLRSQDPAVLRYIGHLGIAMDVGIVVTEKAPFSGPIHLKIDGGGGVKRVVVGGVVAASIIVKSLGSAG